MVNVLITKNFNTFKINRDSKSGKLKKILSPKNTTSHELRILHDENHKSIVFFGPHKYDFFKEIVFVLCAEILDSKSPGVFV